MTPLKVQPRIKRVRRLLVDLRPTRRELEYFVADSEAVEVIEDWEADIAYDDDVLEYFVVWRCKVAANRIAAQGDPHSDLDETEQARRWAVTLADAVEASADEQVQRWRSDWLGGQTIEWADLESTLRGLPVEDRDPDGEPRWMRLLTPDCDRPGYRWPRVRIDGSRALEALDGLAARLSNRWWWSAEQAVVFVVTGLPPLAWTLKAVAAERDPGRTRVVLTVDPAVPVDHVVRAYVAARRPYVRAGRPVEADTWDAVSWRLSHLDESAADAARGWLRRRGMQADRAAINAWRRKVKAALERLEFDDEEN